MGVVQGTRYITVVLYHGNYNHEYYNPIKQTKIYIPAS